MSSCRAPERRDLEDDVAEPVVKVLAELAAPHRLLQVAVRGRDHPHVGPDRPRGAHRPQLSTIEEAEQHALGVEGQLADLIQEHRAAVGQREEALLAGDGAGEGSPLVPEEFAREQLARQRGAVHDLVGSVSSGR